MYFASLEAEASIAYFKTNPRLFFVSEPSPQLDSKLTVNEIYASVQGESTFVGLPCTFVRLTFCDLRCSYCDTEYAFYEGEKMSLSDILHKVERLSIPLVEITGGEPLAQKNVLPLMKTLCDRHFQVLLETGGHRDISSVDPRVHRIVDLKCPSSGMSDRMYWDNIEHLTSNDEVKFVIGSQEDYQWAKQQIKKYSLETKAGTLLFSPVFGKINPQDIVNWILQDQLPVRFQLQLHKFIWDPAQKSV